ncbi:PP2C family protein-serine/threonine phosphatase [Simkania sp.]|uniref:PP2C family protein-serine/threonine phosphatase n=1 Tax=Simkania sp. TaxID=34094 RepID=UPI003B51846E
MDFEEKNRQVLRGLSGSLAFRILLIETILLVIPLLIFAGLMYYEDSRLQAKDNRFTLELILHGKGELIQEVMVGESDFLKYVDKIHPSESKLQSLADRDLSTELFHLVQKQGKYVCDEASLPELIGRDFSEIIPQKLPAEGMLIGTPETNRFYFLQPFSHGNEVWATGFSPKRLTDKLSIEKNIPYPTVISLLSDSGTVLLSTDTTWQKWHLPSAREKEEQFSFLGENYVGEFEKIPRSNLLLLVAAPRHTNFVDIPYFLAKMIILLLIILVVGGGATIWLTVRLGKPLRNLCAAMEQLRSADLSARYVPDRMGFEINVVGTIFNAMIVSLNDFIHRIKQEKAAKEAFERELMIGQEVQNSILPKELPTFPGLDIAARFISAKEVGGDFYDFLVRPAPEGDRLFFAIADTAGKGIYACLYSLTVRSMLRSYGEMHQDLETITKETNNLFCLDTGDSGVFVTAWLAFYDEKTKELHFSNCGHFPAYLLRADGAIEKLTTEGMALGVEKFDEVQTSSVQLSSGDSLLLFTDGVVEAHNDQMKMFGEKRLMESYKDRKELKAKEIVDELIEEVAFFAGGAPQHDDLTLIVIKVED